MYKTLKAYGKRLAYRAKVYSRFAKYSLLPAKQQKIVDQFHKLFYDSHIMGKTWNNTFFLGHVTQKCPFDLFVYQEIIYEIKPDVIIETGTAFGGGSLFLATICDLLNKGKVITVDVTDNKGKPKHKRITYLVGSSTAETVVDKVKRSIGKKDKVLVILDSDHSEKHVSEELSIYNNLVSKGSYIIVEDTNVNGHPVYSDHGPGPMEAVKNFLSTNKNFVADKSREKYYLTFNPNGYLKRIS